ncbi:MAG: hypothetical protein PVG53_13200 [Holophagae bacterium]|jgi:hypothetical protein
MTSPQPTASSHADEIRATLPDDVQPLVVRASELRRRRAGGLAEAPLATAVPSIDRVLGGGLPRGAMVELVGRGSCGRFSTLLGALQQVTGVGESAALVDQGSQLDPQAAAAVGIDLARLLWLRPERLDDSLAAAEMLVGTGFRLVTLDLGLPPVLGRPPLAAWLRLARSAAEHGAVVLVGSPYRVSGCAAAAVLTSGWGRGRWSGVVGGLRLLDGLTARLTLDKCVGLPDRSNRYALSVFTTPDAAFRGPVSIPSTPSPARRQRHVQNL